MEAKILLSNVSKIKEPSKISADRVTKLFSECKLKESDFDEDGLTCNFYIGEGVQGKSVFSIPRLNEHREELDQYISQLRDIDHAPSFKEFFYDADGNKWTEETVVVDMLVQLGMASNMLFFTMPEQLWPYLPEGIPFIGKQIYSPTKGITGIEAKIYTKMFDEDK